ncbi:nitrilase-related carbon-nitrogen hydrolase [Thermovenabulum gondwanense]|uniref:Nitrilase n=1 Tax=Thermovenabulum gondwanense TaxID=520767 RepID=A0A162MQ46_9FIRM|nr:nitrilase-related carbon-nitrogen hydrolase [Thermovenabulum gondwanense]KYO66920.1 Nitrilase [Thermovenabulum gondwanense]
MFKLGILQFAIEYKNPEANREKVKELISKASKFNPDILVLPETWTTGYSEEVFDNIMDYAEKEDGPSVTLLKNLAKESGVYIVGGSLPEFDGENTYNTIFFIDKKGEIIGKYRKMHLYSAMREDKGFKNGSEMPVFSTEFGKIALMTCYDIRFPELSRTYAVRGAQIIITARIFSI